MDVCISIHLLINFTKNPWNNSVFINSSFYFVVFSGPASKIIVKFCIACTCGIIGAIFTFPGLRMARMHWDSLKYCKDSKAMQILLNVSFALPFILVMLWVKPLSKNYMTGHTFGSMQGPLWEFGLSGWYSLFWLKINFCWQFNRRSVRLDSTGVGGCCRSVALHADAGLPASVFEFGLRSFGGAEEGSWTNHERWAAAQGTFWKKKKHT